MLFVTFVMFEVAVETAREFRTRYIQPAIDCLFTDMSILGFIGLLRQVSRRRRKTSSRTWVTCLFLELPRKGCLASREAREKGEFSLSKTHQHLLKSSLRSW